MAQPRSPFPGREHLWGDTPPQNLGGSQEPADIGGVLVVSSLLPTVTAAGWVLKTGSSVVQSQGESCYGRVSKKPKLAVSGGQPQWGGEQGAGPQGHRAGPQLKEELVKAGETQGPAGCTDGVHAESEKEVSMPVVRAEEIHNQ